MQFDLCENDHVVKNIKTTLVYRYTGLMIKVERANQDGES